MKILRYQEKAVRRLTENVIDQLKASGYRRKIVFKAPTGSGKTVMACQLLEQLSHELPAQFPQQDIAYIWIAPNKLHIQSFTKVRNYFDENQTITPVMFGDLDQSADGALQNQQVLFVNWESINQDNNLIMRDTERGASLYDIVRHTKEQGTLLVVIIDEEHLYAGRAQNQSVKVLNALNAKLELRISATPTPQQQNAFVEITRDEVIAEQMIKRNVIINPALKDDESSASLDQLMLRQALQKRDELAEAYKRLGVDINPLLLIQLPNDSERMTTEDQQVAEEVKAYLNVLGITEENEQLAIWLSKEKSPFLQHITLNNSLTKVLLFKQAIAYGWDCPRAAVLLIYRHLQNDTFTIQTVGRILRMPEQIHYTDERLNTGYVYTDLSKNEIRIVNEDLDYLSLPLSSKRREGLVNVNLQSQYAEYLAVDRNRLSADFYAVLQKAFNSRWLNGQLSLLSLFDGEDESEQEDAGELAGMQTNIYKRNRDFAAQQGIEFNVQSIRVSLANDVEITPDELGVVEINDTHRVTYVRRMSELTTAFNDFCLSLLSGYEKTSVVTLSYYLKQFMEEAFQCDNNTAVLVILAAKNRKKFAEVISAALTSYSRTVAERRAKAKERSFRAYDWEVPETREYNQDTHHIDAAVQNHALMPFVRLNHAFNPEKEFEAFLEANTQYIDWWYKNGDSGKQHLAIPYTNTSGNKDLFYVDFVVRLKSGNVFLFDTKTLGSDLEGANKHNALWEYMHAEENADKHLHGGILIQHHNGNWMYSPLKVENITDISGWKAFFPDQL